MATSPGRNQLVSEAGNYSFKCITDSTLFLKDFSKTIWNPITVQLRAMLVKFVSVHHSGLSWTAWLFDIELVDDCVRSRSSQNCNSVAKELSRQNYSNGSRVAKFKKIKSYFLTHWVGVQDKRVSCYLSSKFMVTLYPSGLRPSDRSTNTKRATILLP